MFIVLTFSPDPSQILFLLASIAAIAVFRGLRRFCCRPLFPSWATGSYSLRKSSVGASLAWICFLFIQLPATFYNKFSLKTTCCLKSACTFSISLNVPSPYKANSAHVDPSNRFTLMLPSLAAHAHLFLAALLK